MQVRRLKSCVRAGGTHLEQGDDIRIRVTERSPFRDQRRHEDVDIGLVVERGTDRVGQGSDRVVQDEQVLLLVLVERKDEVAEDRPEERLEFGTRLLLERRERRAARFLHALVVVEAHLEQAFHRRNKVLLLVLGGGVVLDGPARVPSDGPACDRPDERLRVVERVDQETHQNGQVLLNAGDAAWGERTSETQRQRSLRVNRSVPEICAPSAIAPRARTPLSRSSQSGE